MSTPPYGPPPPPQGGGGWGPPQGWPPQQGWGPPTHGARQNRSGLTLAAILGAVFAVATVVVAVVTHHHDNDSSPDARLPGQSVAGSGLVNVGGQSGQPGQSVPSGATPSGIEPSVAIPTVPTFSPSPTPTHKPLDPGAVNRVFEEYMDALLDHDLGELHSATCPKYRHTETGFALYSKYYIYRWRGLEYTIEPELNYTIVPAKVYRTDASSGASRGTHVYRWYVARSHTGNYYVCGILK